MKEKLQKIKEEAIRQIQEAADLSKLNDVRVAILGKKGELTAVLKGMKDVSPEERPLVGQMVNETRENIERILEETKAKLEAAELDARLRREVIDVTLPAKKNKVGHRHPNTIALEEVERIFTGMGYEVVEGPEIEYDYYNFEALNIPANHPAKDEQDTFYINDKIVLRTQTSPVQVREMEKGKLPIRMIAPGRVFRSDEVDATHSPSFHQIEGLVIDKNITFADLKGTLAEFARQLFGQDTKVKFRPHHFPFTEPSAEMDVTCFKCGGKGCRFCKGEGWIEILGCGMVHPRVLRMSGIDPEEYSGFAFGIGLERIALLKYEIDDMRLLYENDQRFLNQFSVSNEKENKAIMNTSLKWIKELVPGLACTPQEYMDAMTLSGSKVEGYENMDEDLDKIVIGQVKRIERHPDADKLVICQVDIGTETTQIVTGATNVTEGCKVPVVLDGGRVAGGHDGSRTAGGIKIKKGKLRGVESNGMMCSIEELGSNRDMFPLAPEDGLYILPDDAPVGADAVAYLGLDDTVVEYEITSNRVDCFSVLGIAREAAATFGKEFVPPTVTATEIPRT